MAREKEGFRDQLELITRKIEERYPDSLGMLTTEQVADYLGCTVKTVLNNINRRCDPLPAKNISVGRTVWRIPIISLARWSMG